jgi:hypothetical protein
MMIFIAFIVGLITDWVWTKYFRSVAEHKAFVAANWSIAIYLCGVFATYLLVDKEYFAMAAYLFGGYIGTYFAIKHGEPKMIEDKTC